MDDVVDSMTDVMDSPWFFVVIAFFVLLALAPLLATRFVARREDQRTTQRPDPDGGGSGPEDSGAGTREPD